VLNNNIHATRLKSIRPYVSFDYDLRKPLTRYAKQKIKKYFDLVQSLTARPNQIYRPRSPQRLKPVQRFAQHNTTLSELTVAFVPTPVPVRIEVKNGAVMMRGEHVITQNVPLDPHSLAIDPQQHVSDRIAQHAPAAKMLTIQAGRYEIPFSLSPDTVGDHVARLTERYSTNDGHHYSEWLYGLNAHTYINQTDFDNYDAVKRHEKAKLAKSRKSTRLRAARRKKAKK